MRTLTALPLHGGSAPKWLFSRMVRLGERISDVIIEEYGADELLARLANTNWFQAFACALGYDWHSSGTTTVTMGALKVALAESKEIAINGGKGKAGTNTPNDIEKSADRLGLSSPETLIRYSRLSAKIDSAMVYDNISIYHHSFIFTKSGRWAVVQQGMEQKGTMAVRFQWDSALVDKSDISNEPHSGIHATARRYSIDLSSESNKWSRESFPAVLEELAVHSFDSKAVAKAYPSRHQIIPEIDLTKRGIEALSNAYELSPRNYEQVLLSKGIGRKTVKSLALISSLIYDKDLALRDPIIYAYNVGGKDGIPYRINRQHYDDVIKEMSRIVDSANIESSDKYAALKSLAKAVSRTTG
ncbi:MAG: DUF763 domain-containing protein [Candidatus Micrarchaeia archaeon]